MKYSMFDVQRTLAGGAFNVRLLRRRLLSDGLLHVKYEMLADNRVSVLVM